MRFYYDMRKIRVGLGQEADIKALLSCLSLDPHEWDTWFCGPLNIHDAMRIPLEDSMQSPYVPPQEGHGDTWTPTQHLQRIRYLMMQDNLAPITIWFGPDGPEILDGNHRLAAAYLRGDETIPMVTLGDGSAYTQE